MQLKTKKKKKESEKENERPFDALCWFTNDVDVIEKEWNSNVSVRSFQFNAMHKEERSEYKKKKIKKNWFYMENEIKKKKGRAM